MQDQIHIGIITWYDHEKDQGFIKDENGNSYYFTCNRSNQSEKSVFMVEFSAGDEVNFRLKRSEKYKDRLEAWNVRFVPTRQEEQFLKEAATNNLLQGQLIAYKPGKFFVKHDSTQLFIALPVSDWETDLHSVYHERVNKPVTFSLLPKRRDGKLMAFLPDRKFCDAYKQITALIESGRPIEAKLTHKNEHGFFTVIPGYDLEAFILLKELTGTQKEKLNGMKKNDTIPVTIKGLFKNKRVSVALVED